MRKEGMRKMPEAVVSQSPAISSEELRKYIGKWVAIRSGHVVASADTFDDLRENENVRRHDAVYVVPQRGPFFY